MSEFIWHNTTSLDGFAAGPDDSMDRFSPITRLRFHPYDIRRNS